MQELIVDRHIWARGSRSHLLNVEGPRQQCCVGIYLSALGVDDDYLRGNACAEQVDRFLPNSARWLVGKGIGGNELYPTNDDPWMTDEERERRIAELFAEHDIRVVFKG